MKRLTPAQMVVFLCDLVPPRQRRPAEDDLPTQQEIEQNRRRLKTRRAIEDILEERRLKQLDDL